MAVGHWMKVRSRGVYESIRKTPTGKTTEISVASSPSIPFFPWVAPKGPFWPFLGPGGSGADQKMIFNQILPLKQEFSISLAVDKKGEQVE